MDISTLFEIVAKGPKPFKLAEHQFEFDIDQKSRRIVGALAGFLSVSETVRIQGNRPFTWTGEAVLPDTSLGVLRTLRCQVNLQGILPATDPALRDLLQLLLQDGFDFDRLLSRCLSQTVAELRDALKGQFFTALTSDVKRVYAGFADSLRKLGLPVTQVELRPRQYDTRPAFDLVDETEGVIIRSRDSLELNRATYKARLVWGTAPDQMIACLAYQDKVITGRSGTAMAQPLVHGQVVPLEAYFRQLLAAALAEESWTDVIADDAALLDRVAARISAKLGCGTGRVVKTLVIHPVLKDLVQRNERAYRFLHEYPIMGTRGGKLQIEHAIRFTLIDRDRWVAQKSPDPEIFLRNEMRKATELFLHDKRFEDVVGLYLGRDDRGLARRGEDGKGELEIKVEERVKPIALTIGYRLDSSSVILAIPEHDFVEGTEIALREDAFQLADQGLKPKMRIRVTVRVVNGTIFARALARQEDFRKQIEDAIEQNLRNALRGQSALNYYSSPSVNGVALPPDSSAPSDAKTHPQDAFTSAIHNSLTQMLELRFGLTVDEFDIQPSDDPIITRMLALASHRIPYDAAFEFARGSIAPAIRMQATATVFITVLSPQHWSSFYRSVPRYADAGAHIEAICAMLTQTLRLIEHALIGDGRSVIRPQELRAQNLQQRGAVADVA